MAGASNEFIWILTRELGRIGVRARGIRKLESKLRFGMQPYSLVQVSVVRGKSGWQLTGAEPLENFYFTFNQEPEKRRVLVRIVQLIRRLVHGERPDTYLYDTTERCLSYLRDHTLSSEDIRSVERLTVLRVLDALGYLERREKLLPYLKNTHFSDTALDQFRKISDEALTEINRTLGRVQL